MTCESDRALERPDGIPTRERGHEKSGAAPTVSGAWNREAGGGKPADHPGNSGRGNALKVTSA